MPLNIGKPVPVSELLAKPSGRQLNERDRDLDALMAKVADTRNKDVAFPWVYGDTKPITARAAANRAIARAGLVGEVFVSARDGVLYFSQQRLSERGRRKDK